MTAANVFAAANLLMGIAMILVALGKWGGNIEARSHQQEHGHRTNGSMSLGEVERRLKSLEETVRNDRREYLSLAVANEKFRSLWDEVRSLRRRVESILGNRG